MTQKTGTSDSVLFLVIAGFPAAGIPFEKVVNDSAEVSAFTQLQGTLRPKKARPKTLSRSGPLFLTKHEISVTT